MHLCYNAHIFIEITLKPFELLSEIALSFIL